jgi:hypothetical protein
MPEKFYASAVLSISNLKAMIKFIEKNHPDGKKKDVSKVAIFRFEVEDSRKSMDGCPYSLYYEGDARPVGDQKFQHCKALV